MHASITGLLCLMVFALSQAVRDAVFAGIFQSVSFLFVAVLAFGSAAAVFAGWAWLRRPADMQTLLSNRRSLAALNLTTAGAWLAYFFALSHLEPAIVNMLFVGVGRLAVVALSVRGHSDAGPVETGVVEGAAYAGILGSLLAIVVVALLGRSGVEGVGLATRVLALTSVLIGGVVITVSHMIARRFSDDGVGSDAILGMRFLLTVAVALVGEAMFGQPSMRPEPQAVPWLAAAAFALIVMPNYFLQLGVARASPLAVNVIRALGPVFVFAAQQIDDRVHFSGPTLACVIAFALFACVASMMRGWAEVRRHRP